MLSHEKSVSKVKDPDVSLLIIKASSGRHTFKMKDTRVCYNQELTPLFSTSLKMLLVWADKTS